MRRPVAGRRRLAQLGEQQGEVGAQRAEAVEPAGPQPQVVAQDGDDRAVGRRRTAAGGAAEDERRGGGGRLLREPRLADPGFAREEQQAAGARACAVGRLGQPRALGVAPEERARQLGQPATGAGSGRTTTVSAIGTTSSAGIAEARAWARIASGLSPS